MIPCSQELEICENEAEIDPNLVYNENKSNDDENKPVMSILNLGVDFVVSQPTAAFKPDELFQVFLFKMLFNNIW